MKERRRGKEGEREKDKESEKGCQKVRMSDERWQVRMEGTVVFLLRQLCYTLLTRGRQQANREMH